MRVGLNLVYLTESSGGSGTYARELIPALLRAEPETRITAFVGRELPVALRESEWASEVDWVRVPVNVTHGPPGTFTLAIAAQWLALPALARRRRLDVMHGLANVVAPFAPGVATVVTLHDLIWLRHPHTMSRAATLGMKMTAPFSARHADRVIAVSEFARGDLVRTLGLAPDRVDAVPHGVRVDRDAAATPEAELRHQLGLGDAPVVLCVAQKYEHKNLDSLVRALARAGGVVLVLVGSATPYERRLKDLAVELRVEDRVRFPGWVSGEDLEGLYRLSSCFVLPSFEEGFGLPILEAMARGVPVACSSTASLPEVAGDAALLFDPRRPDEIAGAIERLLRDRALARRLVDAGRRRCAEFTWEATARGTLDTYRRARIR